MVASSKHNIQHLRLNHHANVNGPCECNPLTCWSPFPSVAEDLNCDNENLHVQLTQKATEGSITATIKYSQQFAYT